MLIIVTLVLFSFASSFCTSRIRQRTPLGRREHINKTFGTDTAIFLKKSNCNHESKASLTRESKTDLKDGTLSPVSDVNKSRVRMLLDFYDDNVTKKGYNGFTELSELINGRLAMAGLVFGYIKEYYTGETLLEQVGIGKAPWETVREITADWGALALCSFIIATISIFNLAPPPVASDDDGI